MIAPLPRYRLLLAAGLLFVGMMLVPIHFGVNATFWDTLMDAVHVPIFAGLTWLLVTTNPAGFAGRNAALAFSALAALVVAALIEIAQNYCGRTGNVDDWIKGAIGVGSAVLILGGRPYAGLLAGGFFTALFLVPTTMAANAILWRAVHFPVLADFESEVEVRLWAERDHDHLSNLLPMRVVPHHATHGEHALKVQYPSGAWPGVRLLCGDQDWSGYTTLAFDIENEGESFTLSLRIDDSRSKDSTDRFNYEIPLKPGTNFIRIPLQEIAAQPRGRPLNLEAVRRIVFFEKQSDAGRVYFLDYVRLE